MKCVICKSSDIEYRKVEEEIRSGSDIVLVPLEVLVCLNCGERFYSRSALQEIEGIKSRLKTHTLEVEEIGKVLRMRAA